MKLVDTLSLKQKLYILLGIVVLALVLSASIGYFNISKMKKNLDSLYFGNLIPITELNNIQNEYNKDIIITFYQFKNGDIIPSEASEKINVSREKILDTWNSYKSHFKRDYEVSYIEYTNNEIEKLNQYLQALSKTIVSLDEKDLSKLSPKIFLKNLSHINEVIKKIITYESQMAQYERKALLVTYDETIYKLVAIFIFIIIVAIIIMTLVLKSIQKNQISLIKTSKKLQDVNKKLEIASITDPLTKLYNRRYFNLVFNRELARCAREKKRIGFMMLDIDYFKGYNDTYGHLEGDTALKAVATAMKDTLRRPTDYLFRLGGEEFGVLISDLDNVKSVYMAEKLRQTIQDLKIEHEKNKAASVLTISIGLITLIPDKDTDHEDVLKKADKNLYQAKEEGRNKIIMTKLTKEVQPEYA